MIVKLLTEHHLEFPSLKEGCTGSSEPTHVNMPHCWKSHALAQLYFTYSYSSHSRASSALLLHRHMRAWMGILVSDFWPKI